MRTDRPDRRALAFTMGVAAIFDLTGATIYRIIRPRLPATPPRGTDADPFTSAMSTIMAAHHEAVLRAHDESGVTLPA
ncbi:MAG TPA: hypothetical protein VGI64_15905 [Streptosporangiaceae bacterium]|jgi:hypothetical protein